MQVGEQGLLGAQHPDLDRLRLLDAEDHVRLREDRVGGVDDPCPLGLVVGVGDRAALARSLLNQYLVPVLGELAGADRGQRDPVFLLLDLGRDSNLHLLSSFLLGCWLRGVWISAGHLTSSRARSASQSSIRSWAWPRSRPVSSSILRIR